MEAFFVLTLIVMGIITLYNYGTRIIVQNKLSALNEDIDKVTDSVVNAKKRKSVTCYNAKDKRMQSIFTTFRDTFLQEKLNTRIEAQKYGHRNDVSA